MIKQAMVMTLALMLAACGGGDDGQPDQDCAPEPGLWSVEVADVGPTECPDAMVDYLERLFTMTREVGDGGTCETEMETDEAYDKATGCLVRWTWTGTFVDSTHGQADVTVIYTCPESACNVSLELDVTRGDD